MSAFFFWMTENRDRLKKPGMGVADVAKAAGVEWSVVTWLKTMNNHTVILGENSPTNPSGKKWLKTTRSATRRKSPNTVENKLISIQFQ